MNDATPGRRAFLTLAPGHAVRRRDRDRPSTEESPPHEGQERSPARRRVIHRVCRIAWSGPRGRAPSHFLGEGAMFGATDHRDVGPGSGGVEEAPDRLAAP